MTELNKGQSIQGRPNKRIDAYSLADLLQAVQENILDGYLIDLESNENYPQIIGHHYTLGMVFNGNTVTIKDKLDVVKEDTDKLTEEVEVKSKPGRKPKEV